MPQSVQVRGLTMPKYRKKPVVIEAVQWNGDPNALREFGNHPTVDTIRVHYPDLQIDTLEGRMTAKPGDWIIRGVNGEFYPCKPDIFEKTYELVTIQENG